MIALSQQCAREQEKAEIYRKRKTAKWRKGRKKAVKMMKVFVLRFVVDAK